jgi:hypothetical protein
MNTHLIDHDHFSDCYKSEIGVRPRGYWSDAEIANYFEGYDERVEEAIDAEKQAVNEFWTNVNNKAAEFEVDQGTYLRWLMDSYEDEQAKTDIGYFCYLAGIGYDSQDRIKELIGK